MQLMTQSKNHLSHSSVLFISYKPKPNHSAMWRFDFQFHFQKCNSVDLRRQSGGQRCSSSFVSFVSHQNDSGNIFSRSHFKGKHYYLIPAYDFHETSYATRQLYPWTKIEIKVGSHRPRFHGIRTFWMFLMHFRKPLVADMCFNIYAFYCKNNLNTR